VCKIHGCKTGRPEVADKSARLKICEFVKYSSKFASLVCGRSKNSNAPTYLFFELQMSIQHIDGES
jgi:hypothetical protein